uniref:Ig-like domain-containing protein n=1 Tax=Monopterus albus TaxID=43700 RepID=A0A3Q3Q020_MONAL
MMACLKFALYLTCALLWRIELATNNKLSSSVHQDGGFISANVGDNVTLRCFYEGDVAAMFYWYKQTLQQKPRLLSSFYKHDTSGIFYAEFKDNPRFSLETNNGKNHLTILNLQISDSATYYCTSCYSYEGNSSNSLVCFLSGALIFTTVMIALLALSIYKEIKRNVFTIYSLSQRPHKISNAVFHYFELHKHFLSPPPLHWVALEIKMPNFRTLYFYFIFASVHYILQGQSFVLHILNNK